MANGFIQTNNSSLKDNHIPNNSNLIIKVIPIIHNKDFNKSQLTKDINNILTNNILINNILTNNILTNNILTNSTLIKVINPRPTSLIRITTIHHIQTKVLFLNQTNLMFHQVLFKVLKLNNGFWMRLINLIEFRQNYIKKMKLEFYLNS